MTELLDERARLVRATRNQQLLDLPAPLRALVPRLVRDAITLGILAHAGVDRWRLGAITGAMLLLALVPRALRHWRGRGDHELRSFALALGVQLLSVGTILLTGAMASPFLPGIVGVAVLPTSMFGCDRYAPHLTVLLVGAIALLAAAPPGLAGPLLDSWHHVPLLLINLGWAYVIARAVMVRVHDATTAADRTLLQLRGEQVAEAEALPRRLQEVSARVAHELKNPLAAIKGLVQLVRRGAPDPRLEAVEGDIARVQHVVTEYLTFSRPQELGAAPVEPPAARVPGAPEHVEGTVPLLLLLSVLMISSLLVLLWLDGMAGWRLAIVGAAWVLNLGLQAAVAARWTRRPQSAAAAERGMVLNHLLNGVWTGCVLAVTGGVRSPLLPMASTALVLGTQLETVGIRRSGAIALTVLLELAVVASLPVSVTGAAPSGWHFDAITISAIVWAMFVLRVVNNAIAATSDRTVVAADAMRAERLRDAQAMIRRLRDAAARVADELRPPLAAMHATISDVLKLTPESRAAERLRVVAGEIARIQRIVAEYLSSTRPLDDLDPEPVDLAVLAGESAAVVAGRAETAQVSIALDTRPSRLHADPRRLREALLNVLSNALDATPAGGTIRVETASTPEGGATITVVDSGRGMPPELLARLGQSFLTTRAEGTGLGVVLIKGVIARHGGSVAYDSAPGRGTRVTLTLPSAPPTHH